MKRKPDGYWNDFANIERELGAFIAEHGIVGIMPTQHQLTIKRRQDLTHAISKHGGIAAVAKRLGLKQSVTTKSRGYWKDFANLKKDLLAFIAEQGTQGVMPTLDDLKTARRMGLVGAVTKHGGFISVAKELNLKPTRKADRYWDDLANLKKELFAFIDEYGIKGVMPTYNDMASRKRTDLTFAINKHGGMEIVARAFDLDGVRRSPGYWEDFSNVRKELLEFIVKHGEDGAMPTHNDLVSSGRSALSSAINKHGGIPVVAKRLGLERPNAQKPGGYWDDFANLEKELRTFISVHVTDGVFPTYSELAKYGRTDLAYAVNKHGGFALVAEKLGLAFNRKTPGYWEDFANVERELRSFIVTYGEDGVMPLQSELRNRGRTDLAFAINKHGGFPIVAERLGFKRPSAQKPEGYWDDFVNVEKELRTFIVEHGTETIMPTAVEFRTQGHSDLIAAIDKHGHGGFSVVARKLGLTYSQEHISLHTATSVEQTARAIQPLAESNLLSGAQVMVILRRAGLLDYRNQRILRLNAGLARGMHNEIESAIANLVSGGEEIAVEPVAVAESDVLSAEEAEALASVGLDALEGKGVQLNAPTVPATQREQAVIRGLSALGELRLPLDNVLQLLTSKILWQSFYKRLYSWYGSLDAAQTVTPEDVDAAILSAYPEHTANEFVAEASALFAYEVEQAVNFSASLADFGWCGPRLRLHQADAARRMAEVLGRLEVAATQSQSRPSSADAEPVGAGQLGDVVDAVSNRHFLLNADDPGMGKSASFLAAVAASDIRTVVLVAPKTVADDTWCASHGEIRRCLPHARIVRGLAETLKARPSSQLTFFVLHYEELLNEKAVAALTKKTFDCLLLDEIHFIKQRAAQEPTLRRSALETLRACARTAIGLTGTPLINELSEPMSLLQTLSQHAPQFDHARLSSRRMSDVADVFEALLPNVIRRRKDETLLHLPGCDVRPVPIPLPPDLDAQMLEIYGWQRSRATQALIELRKLSTDAKLAYLVERAKAARKLLVLTYLTDDISDKIADYLEEFFPGQVAHINGQTPDGDRETRINSFRSNDGVRVLVGTTGTIGTGLTLFDPQSSDTASEIIFADLPYTYAEFDQGNARLYREGQKQRVRVDVLQTTTTATLRDGSALHTLDERIWDLIEGKRELADIAIDGKYDTTDAAAKVRKALRRWLKQAREIGVEPLSVERRATEQTSAQHWRGEIARLRGVSAVKADEVFADPNYTREFLEHLKTSLAAQLSHQWLRGKLSLLLRPDLAIVDMGCGLNPFADLPCRVIGLDRHDLPGQLRGKMENPSLPDRSADVLIFSLSLYGTTSDLLAYFTHAARILRGGGHLFIVEPDSSFTAEGLARFVNGLRQFGFELVGSVKDLRGEDGTLLKGMHLTLTGEMGKPRVEMFERK